MTMVVGICRQCVCRGMAYELNILHTDTAYSVSLTVMTVLSTNMTNIITVFTCTIDSLYFLGFINTVDRKLLSMVNLPVVAV